MFLCDRKSSQTCTHLFDMLRDVTDSGLFQKLFRVIFVGDGSGSFDPDMIENWRPGVECNLAKQLPRTNRCIYLRNCQI